MKMTFRQWNFDDQCCFDESNFLPTSWNNRGTLSGDGKKIIHGTKLLRKKTNVLLLIELLLSGPKRRSTCNNQITTDRQLNLLLCHV